MVNFLDFKFQIFFRHKKQFTQPKALKNAKKISKKSVGLTCKTKSLLKQFEFAQQNQKKFVTVNWPENWLKKATSQTTNVVNSFMNQVLAYIWNPEMLILQRQEDIAEQPSRQCTAPWLCVNFSLHKIWICYYEYFNCLKHKYCAVAFKAVYDYFNWTIQISQKYQYSNSTNVTIVIAQIWIF